MENALLQYAIDATPLGLGTALGGTDETREGDGRPRELVRVMRLLQEAGRALPSDHNQAHRCLQEAVALLQDTPRPDANTTSAASRCRLAGWQVARVRAFVETNLDAKFSIDELSAVARLSPSHFSRAFRSSVGMAPHAYVMSRRVKRAQEMIRDTDKPLSEIALDCGLADQAHMTKLFRRLVGVSPGAWRRHNRTALPDAVSRVCASCADSSQPVLCPRGDPSCAGF